jgi:ribosomal protein S28E/S33
MPFVSLPTRNVGDPVVIDDIILTKENFDDHESRISQLELNDNRIDVYNGVIYNANSFSTLTGILTRRMRQSFTLTSATITIFDKTGITGTLQVDIKKNTTLNPVGFSSVFTTQPSVNYTTAASYSTSTNAVFDITGQNVATGDYLKIDITSMPTSGVVSRFLLTVYGEI